jgi:hypothetical protein
MLKYFQLKKKKFSEVMTQCRLPYDKTNIEMDLENDVRESFECVPEEDAADKVSISRILNLCRTVFKQFLIADFRHQT